MVVFVRFENESMCYLCEIYRSQDLLRPRPHVSVFVRKRRLFSPVWPTVHTFPVETVSENASFKNIKKKALQSTVKVFDNAGFSLRCGRTKMEVFEYDDIIHHLPPVHCISLSAKLSNTKRSISASSGHFRLSRTFLISETMGHLDPR